MSESRFFARPVLSRNVRSAQIPVRRSVPLPGGRNTGQAAARQSRFFARLVRSRNLRSAQIPARRSVPLARGRKTGQAAVSQSRFFARRVVSGNLRAAQIPARPSVHPGATTTAESPGRPPSAQSPSTTLNTGSRRKRKRPEAIFCGNFLSHYDSITSRNDSPAQQTRFHCNGTYSPYMTCHNIPPKTEVPLGDFCHFFRENLQELPTEPWWGRHSCLPRRRQERLLDLSARAPKSL